MKRQTGFTLIELVMAIVILGVLAAAAMPKFLNLKGDAQAAALAGVGGSIQSALAMNLAISAVNPANAVSTFATNIAGGSKACTIVFGRLLNGGLPPEFVIGTDAIAANPPLNSPTAGTVRNCFLSADGVTSMVIPVAIYP